MKWWQKDPFFKLIVGYDQLSTREQAIILYSSVFILFSLIFLTFVEPNIIAGNKDKLDIKSIMNSNKTFEANIEKVSKSKHTDPNLEIRNNLLILTDKEKALDLEISALTKALVDPKKMVFILEQALKESRGIKLISLRNLASENVYIEAPEIEGDDMLISHDEVKSGDSHSNENNDVSGIIYKHGLEIVVEADYRKMVEYLERLDDIEWKVFWQNLEYEIKEYPKGQLKIKIYTLSTGKEVLGV